MVRTVFWVVLFCGVLFGRDVQSLPIGNEIETDKGIFLNPSLESGKRVASWNDTSKVNPEELGLYAEGDIVYSKRGRNALKEKAKRWPKGVVPYEFNGSFNSHDRDMVQRAIDLYHKYTCIRFRQRTTYDRDYVSIENAWSGCWAHLGRIGGKQILNLQTPACTYSIGTTLHEWMHVLGFEHEHNRYDRDNYVTIDMRNVMPGYEHAFNKRDESKMELYGLKYDFRSIMHYSAYAFSSNDHATIIPKDASNAAKMGFHDSFSTYDIIRLKRMYPC